MDHLRLINIVVFLILIFVEFGVTLEDIESLKNVEETERVIGGSEAYKNMFPYAAALYYRGDYVCTASIISERDILTAAHCVVFDEVPQNPNEYYAIIGNTKRSKGKRVAISKITPHPGYKDLNNDLAVLKTTEEIPFDDSVQPICLATTKIGCLTLKPVTAMGWGITTRDTNSTETSDSLKYIKLRVYPNSKCSLLYFNKVPKNVLCAGALNAGICSGDSGGPLVFKKDKKKDVQVGVASYVNEFFGCARLLGPAGFSSVSHHTKFLQSAVEGKPCFV